MKESSCNYLDNDGTPGARRYVVSLTQTDGFVK